MPNKKDHSIKDKKNRYTDVERKKDRSKSIHSFSKVINAPHTTDRDTTDTNKPLLSFSYLCKTKTIYALSLVVEEYE